MVRVKAKASGKGSELGDVLAAPPQQATTSPRVLKFRAQARWLPFTSILLIGLAALAPYVLALKLDPLALIAALAVYSILLVVFAIVPFCKWISGTTTVTTAKIIIKSGVFVRHRREVVLSQVSEIGLRRGVFQRFLKSGDIIVRTTFDSTVVLRNVPSMMIVAEALQELLSWHAQDVRAHKAPTDA